ncbi:MAG: o-succinylbenzoate synthase [Rhodothermales bacterium]|nr:o-succinylbenzoate synthase [Rhodothermales bacterium]
MLPFTRPVVLGGRRYERRNGLLVKLTDGEDEGWGECAPLPGFSGETLEEARRELVDALHPQSWRRPDSPAARCGLEMALADLARRRGARLSTSGVERQAQTGSEGVSHHPGRPFQSVNAVLLESEGVPEAEALMDAGYSTVKIKVGGDPERDASRVQGIAQATGARVRLDANQSWTLDEARRFASHLGDTAIEYIEEPTNSLEDSRLLSGEGLPVALDESLRGMTPDEVAKLDWPTALVLKPMMMGLGISRGVAERALERGITPVISSSLESDVGLWGLAHFAATLGSADVAAGLGTSRLLSGSLTLPPFPKGPRADLRQEFSVI